MKRQTGIDGPKRPNRLSPLAVLLCASILALGISAQAQIGTDDPMVRITSLPLGLDVKEVMVKLSDDVSRDTGLDKNMVTYYWQTFDAVYCPGCEDTTGNHLIFVDLYVPGFLTDEQIAGLMTSLAASLEKHTGIDKKGVFIHTHVPKEGHVYISGKVVKWEEIKSLD
jgi:hypothetical protein